MTDDAENTKDDPEEPQAPMNRAERRAAERAAKGKGKTNQLGKSSSGFKNKSSGVAQSKSFTSQKSQGRRGSR